MLQLNRQNHPERGEPTGTSPFASQQTFDLRATAAVLRRHSRMIAACILLSFAAAIVYVLVTPPMFTASVTLLIDQRRVQVLRDEPLRTDSGFDNAMMESQLETIRSERVLSTVVKALKLDEDQAFMGGAPSIVGAFLAGLRDLLGPDGGQSSESRARVAMARVEAGMRARRLGLSYTIQIGFTGRDPAKAAAIANEIAEAYILDQLEAKFELTKRAGSWLNDRIRDLREQANAAERAVIDFRAENNIVDAAGKLINEQRLSELNTQLTTARGQTGEAKARLDRLTEVIATGLADANVADALRNEVIVRLRQQYLDAVRREAEWSARYGANHQATVNLRAEADQLQRVIMSEMRRLEQTYQSDFEIAKSREQELTKQIEDVSEQWSSMRQAQVKLRDLESTAQAFRTLQDNFLQRYMIAAQQQSFPISEARVITAASPPAGKSAPKTSLIILGALVLGVGAGVALAFLRETFDHGVRSARQLETVTGRPFLGLLPKARARGDVRTQQSERSGEAAMFKLPRGYGAALEVARAPFSRFAETVREIKVAIDLGRLSRDLRTIGMVSALPGEGKTTVALNLAVSIATAGGRVLLIDADMRNPQLTRLLAPDADAGLVEAISADRRDVIVENAVLGVDVLPCVISTRLHNSHDLLASDAMRALLRDLASRYDYVLVDLPPIVPVVDVRAAAHLIDGFLLIVEAGRTPLEIVAQAIVPPAVREKLLGSVLNKAETVGQRMLGGYEGEYYGKTYA